jgi:LacI family transcriptional regulator
MVTLKDIAAAAGVSLMTVTHALRGTGRISQKRRDQIRKIADELSYVPNEIARGLRNQATKTVSFLVRHLRNPHFASLAEGIEESAWKAGYRVFLCQTNNQLDREREYVHTALSSRTDGMIMTPTQEEDNDHLNLLRQRGVPYVTVGHRPNPLTCPGDHVWSNNYEAAVELARHIIAQGHTRIAIAVDRNNSVTALRTDGFMKALKEHDALDERFVYKQNNGHRLVEEILRDGAPYPTALLLSHNYAAVEVIERLRDHGLRVPTHLAVVCFEDFPDAARIQPLLTVMAQPSYEMGELAMELLLRRMQQNAPLSFETLTVPSRLIVRESCRYPSDELKDL